MPEDRKNASRSPGAEGGESSVKAGCVGKTRGKRALLWGCTKGSQSPGWWYWAARDRACPPPGGLSRGRCGLPRSHSASPPHRPLPQGVTWGPPLMEQEIKNDSSFPGTGELSEAVEGSDFWWSWTRGGGIGHPSYLCLSPHQAEFWQICMWGLLR